MRRVLGISACWAVAALIFWGCFFAAAPAIAALIPAGPWKGLADVAVYFLVAWAGGVALPLVIGIGGTMMIVAAT